MIVVDSNIVAARNLTSSLTSEAKQLRKGPRMDCPCSMAIRIPEYPCNRDQSETDQVEQALDIWEKVSKVLIENECELSASKVIDLVAQYGITAYDGQFIAVALEMGIPCLTEDRELQEKFPGIAISMDEFLKPEPTPEPTYVVREAKARYRKRKRR